MKLLIIITSVSHTIRNNLATGFHFAEFTHAYDFFSNNGYDITVSSPKGGNCAITSEHLEDRINAAFKQDMRRMSVIENTERIADISSQIFDAVYLVGGHGAMFDLADNKHLATVLNTTYARRGVISAVCHGPAGLVGAKDDNGTYLVSGKKVTCFTNNEERATKFFGDMPFLLQSKLVEQGAEFEHSKVREPHLTVDSRIVTGQNPESVELVIGAVHALLMR